MIELLKYQQAEHGKLLAYYQQKTRSSLETSAETQNQVNREQMLQRRVLEYSLRREQIYLEWLEETIERVRSLPE